MDARQSPACGTLVASRGVSPKPDSSCRGFSGKTRAAQIYRKPRKIGSRYQRLLSGPVIYQLKRSLVHSQNLLIHVRNPFPGAAAGEQDGSQGGLVVTKLPGATCQLRQRMPRHPSRAYLRPVKVECIGRLRAPLKKFWVKD